MRKLFAFLILCVSFLICCSVYAQRQNCYVQGTVIDENGDPIIGATVRERGTNNATITDYDGRFKLKLQGTFPTSIIIRFLGYNDHEVYLGQDIADYTIELGDIQMKPDSTEIE